MFDINLFGELDRLNIYVCRPNGELLGCINNEIDESSASLSIGANEDITLEFTAVKDKTSEISWYEHLEGGMYLFVEKVGIFKINQPSITLDGSKDQKSVVANACDIELEDKTCALELNMGTKTSQEYLVTYEDGETEELLNPYTGIPYDWLVLYNTFPEQLTLFKQFVTGGYELGSTTRTFTDSTRIERFIEMTKLIPRLINKITYNSTTGEYTLTEYIRITYENDGVTVQSIKYEGDTLVARIDELITFYTKYRHQLSLLSLVLEETGGDWTVGDIYGVDNNDFTLANKKFQYSVDETIRSFLRQTLAQDTQCIVDFDIFNRKVNMTPVEEFGENTGLIMTYDNLVNTMKITGNDDRFATRLKVTGKDDLTLSQINFGSEYVEDFSYLLNARDAQGNRMYIDDALATKYQAYLTTKEAARTQYIEAAIRYNELLKEIEELKYRVPLDDLSTDWSTFRMDELEETLKNYKNLLAALVALYKEDYGTNGLNNDGSVNETYIKTSEYNYDYFAYLSIINEIECAIATFPYYSSEEKWTSANLTEYKNSIKVWEYNWSLYGTLELQAKIDTYKQNMNVLADSSVMRENTTATYVGADSATHTYYDSNDELISWDDLEANAKAVFNTIAANSGITGDNGETAYYYAIKRWANLSNDEKHKLETQNDYFYDEYMENYNHYVSATAYLTTLQTQLQTLESDRDDCADDMQDLTESVKLKNNFTADEIKLIHRLYRDSDYSNENILVTTIDSIEERFNKLRELLEDGQEKASIYSRPQLKFEIDADNLFGLTEFKHLWDNFVPGNYILVQYRDDVYVKLRLMGFTFNPFIPSSESLTLRFSNYLLSKSEYSDIESLFGNSMGSSGGGGSSVSSGDGAYGQSDDIDITISNTMLAKLLSSEQFGTRVTNIILDTLDVNKLTAKSAKFQGLANGTTTIDGACIKTGVVKSNNYNKNDNSLNNTLGSILKLDEGTFNFGGGQIVWDGATLIINNYDSSTDVDTKISVSEGNIKTYVGDNYETSATASARYSALEQNINGFKTTVSQTYATKDYTDTKYSTLEQTVNGFKTTVSETYETKSDASSTKSALESQITQTATNITSAVSQTYQTKTDAETVEENLRSAISQSADSITLSVSQTYATKDYTDTKTAEVKTYVDDEISGINLTADKISLSGYTDVNGYFSVSQTGQVTIQGGNLSTTTQYSGYTQTTTLNGGNLSFYRDSTLHGRIDAGIMGDTKTLGLVTVPSAIVAFGKFANEDGSGGVTIHTQLSSSGVLSTSAIKANTINADTINVATGNYSASITSLRLTSGSSTRTILDIGSTIHLGTHDILGCDNYSTIVNPQSSAVYFGVPSDEGVKTYIRGEKVYLYPASGVYLGNNGTEPVTSDENVKELQSISTKYETFFGNLTPTLYRYTQGGHRLHIGFGARAVEQALLNAGLNTEEFAGIVIEREHTIPAEVSYSGEDEYYESLYSLRYEEFTALNTHMIQKLQAKVTALETEIEELKKGT